MTIAAHSIVTPTRVWCIELSAALPALLALEAETPRLSPADRSRAARYADGQMAQAWIGARVALRVVLERELGAGVRRVDFDISGRGKPSLPGAHLAFSLSHAAGRALIATGPPGPLGVDLEGERPVRLHGPRRVAIERAGAALSSQPLPDDAEALFLQCWVRLEALSKAEGEGLARVLSRAGAFGAGRRALADPQPQAATGPLLPETLQVVDLALGPGLFAAMATASGVTGAEIGHLPADGDGLRAFVLG